MSKPSRDLQALFGRENLPAIDAMIADRMKDPAMSRWLYQALDEALKRDPIDAVNDTEILLELLVLRLDAVVGTHGHIQFENLDRDERR